MVLFLLWFLYKINDKISLGEIMFCKFCRKKLNKKELVCNSCVSIVRRKLSKLKKILRILSILVFLIFMVEMISDSDYLSAFCFVVCLILLIPSVARFLYNNFKINRLMKYFLIIVIFFIGMVSSSSFNEIALEERDNDNTTVIENNNDKDRGVEANKKDKTGDNNVNKKNKKKTYKINSEEYFKLINDTFIKAIENNECWYYSDAYNHYPYIQVSIKPKKEMSEDVMKEQSKIVGKMVLDELKKYKYKSGGLFAYDYEMINIYFHYYLYGKLSRNGGPFMQFSIYDVDKLTIDDIVPTPLYE